MGHRIISFVLVVACASCGHTADESSVGSYDTATDGGAPDPTPPPEPTRRPELTEDQLAPLRALEGQRSQQALAEVYARFATRPAQLEFQIHSVLTSTLGDAHVQIQQVYAGIPVDARDLHVVVRLDGQLRVLRKPDDFANISLPPQVTHSNRAAGWAHQHGVTLGANKRILVPTLEQRQLPNTAGTNATDWETVVVRFDVGMLFPVQDAAGYHGPKEIFIRDRDEAVIERGLPTNAFAPAMLRGEHVVTNTISTFQSDVNHLYSLKDEFSNTVRVYSLGPFYADQPDNDWGDGSPYGDAGELTTNGETAAADALISLWSNAKMYRNVFGVTLPPVTAHVHFKANKSDDYTDDGWNVDLGYVSSSLPAVALTDVEVVGHEIGHMIISTRTDIYGVGAGEQGGLLEGNADIAGKNAGFYQLAALQPSCSGPNACTWSSTLDITRDWVFASYANQFVRRDFIHPVYDLWSTELNSKPVEEHVAGGPLRLAYYYLTVGICPTTELVVPGSNTSPQRYSPVLPNGLTGLGLPFSSAIWWHAVTDGYYSLATHSYAEFRDVMLQATEDMYFKKNTYAYKAVEDAFAAINVGKPADRDPPEIAIAVKQTSRTAAEVTVDITDPSGVQSGVVYIEHAFKNGFPIVHDCSGHCVWQIDALWFGTSTHHKVRVDATDNADNFTTKTQTFTIDTSPPMITLSPAPTDAPSQTWKVDITDETGIVAADVKVDGTAIESRSWPDSSITSYTFDSISVNKSLEPDGYTIVTFTASDAFGNEGTETVTMLKDTTGPDQCSLVVAPPGSDLSELGINLAGKDKLSGLKLLRLYEEGAGQIIAKISTAGPGMVDGFTNYASYGPGKHTFYGTCEDQKGNLAFSPHVSYWVAAPCGYTNIAGGNVLDIRSIDLGKPSGTVKFTYQTFGIEDRMQIIYEGQVIKDIGCVGTGDGLPGQSTEFSYSGTSTQVTVRVEPNCNPFHTSPTTEWNYTMSCP